MTPSTTENPFESEHFGGGAWSYRYDYDCSPAQVAAAAATESVRLVTCRIPADGDPAAGAALERAGFRLIERLVTLRRPIAPAPEVTHAVSPAGSDDRDACVEIALAALRQDRYHADPRIADQIADAIKAAWVANNLSGRAALSLAARDPAGRTVGFNQLLRSGREAIIDLIAVAPWAQRQGYGRALVAAGLHACAGTADTMRVGTQAANGASLALYRSLGFEVAGEQLTYHLAPESQAR